VGADEGFLRKAGLKSSDISGVIPMGSIMWDVEQEEAIGKYGRERVEQAFRKDGEDRIFGTLDGYIGHWPIRHVREGLPPMLFLIAEAEREHPPVLRTDSAFVEMARGKGNTAEYRVLPDRTHYTAIRKFSEPGDPTFAIVRDFIMKYSKPAAK